MLGGMGEVTLELIYRQMQAGQNELKAALAAVRDEQALTNRKIGAMAEGMVSMSKRLDDLGQQMHMVALAVDEHTTRLNAIERPQPPSAGQ
jgi:hypothetical protein